MNIAKIFQFEKLKNNILTIMRRFPIWILLIGMTTTLFFILLRWNLDNLQEETILRYIFSWIITFFLSLWVYLTSESFEQNKKLTHIFQLIPIWFGVLFLLTFKGNFSNFDQIIYFILTLIWIISYLFIAPFIKKIFSNTEAKNVYYGYFYNISVVFLISSILWWVLFALWSIAIGTVFALFDIQSFVSDKIYWDWAIISLSLLTPIFTLTQLPEKKTFYEATFIANSFFSFLVKYIAIPFIYIYFIILYTYSIKVLLNFWEWPKWEVSWMVIWFSVFWYWIYMFSSIFEEENRFIKFFRKCFPWVVIPQIFMLFYAIYLRIAQYDLTMNRYFVVIFGIWLAIISIYFVLSVKKHIYHIPFILTLFTFVISIWPWWVYSLPESRQLQRLEKNLMQAWILNIQNNKNIIPLKNYEDIDKNLSKEIYEWIHYLCGYNDCKSIKVLFAQIYSDIEKKSKDDFEKSFVWGLGIYSSSEKRLYNGPSSWEIVDGITKIIKVKSYFENMDDSQLETLYFYIDGGEGLFPLDIVWYSKIMRINESRLIWINDRYTKDSSLNSVVDFVNETLEINENGKIFDTLDIKPIIKNLENTYKTDKKTSLSRKNMIYEIAGKNGNYKIILENISIKNPFYTWKINENIYNSIWWYVLVK